jgi:hypothetical protein
MTAASIKSGRGDRCAVISNARSSSIEDDDLGDRWYGGFADGMVAPGRTDRGGVQSGCGRGRDGEANSAGDFPGDLSGARAGGLE